MRIFFPHDDIFKIRKNSTEANHRSDAPIERVNPTAAVHCTAPQCTAVHLSAPQTAPQCPKDRDLAGNVHISVKFSKTIFCFVFEI